MSDDAKVPLPVPDDATEWSAPLWDEDSLRAYGDARERAARAAERERVTAMVRRDRELIERWIDNDPLSADAEEMAQSIATLLRVTEHDIVKDDALRARAEGQSNG